MGEWIRTKIGDQATLQRGIDITRAQQQPGVIPVVSSSGISSYHNVAAVPGPGVVLGRKGVVGSVYYVQGDYWPHDTTLWVKDFHGNDPRFVFYFFKDKGAYLARMDVGSANPTLNRNHIHPIEVDWPCRRDQYAIASILGTLDDKIELNQRTIETQEAMARSLFASRFLSHIVADLIPSGWSYSQLGTVLRVIETGGRPRGGVRDIDDGVPSVGAESIVGIGKFDFSKTKYVPDEFFLQMNRGHVSDGDVLLYKDGGRPGVFEPHLTMTGRGFPFPTFAINEHVYRLRSDPLIPQSYLFFWLSSDAAMDEMRSRGTGVAIPGLNSSAVKQLGILVPDSGALQEFDDQIAPTIDRILIAASEARLLAKIRDALLPKLISGELRIKDAERFVAAAI